MMNTNLISLGALVLAVFVTGSFFGSDLRDRAEVRKEIAALKASQEQAMSEVLKANQAYFEQQKKFNEETQTLYKQLGTLTNQKKEVTIAIAKIKEQGVEQQKEIDLHISNFKSLIKARPVELEPTKPIQ
jgi:predicted transcriptional regulator